MQQKDDLGRACFPFFFDKFPLPSGVGPEVFHSLCFPERAMQQNGMQNWCVFHCIAMFLSPPSVLNIVFHSLCFPERCSRRAPNLDVLFFPCALLSSPRYPFFPILFSTVSTSQCDTLERYPTLNACFFYLVLCYIPLAIQCFP